MSTTLDTVLGVFTCCTKSKKLSSPQKSTFKSSHPSSLMSFAEENDFLSDNWKRTYPLNSVVIFGGQQKIIAKLTKKAVFDYDAKHSRNYFLGSRRLASFVKSWSSLDPVEGLESRVKDYKKPMPENIADYIASRLKCRIMIDPTCRSGEITLKLGKYCQEVIAMDTDLERIQRSKNHAELYFDWCKIDFIAADFLTIRKLNGNLVFLNLIDTRDENETRRCSIVGDLKPDLRPMLVKALQVSRSIALKVPRDIDFEELIELFHSSLEKYGGYSKRYCMEIEEVVDSVTNFGCYMIYFGKCSSIRRVEEYQAVYEYFQQKEDSNNWKDQYPCHVVAAIVEKIGLFRALKYINEVNKFRQYRRDESFFEAFKITLIDENMFSQEKLEQLIEEERKKPVSPTLMAKRFKKARMVQLVRQSSLEMAKKHAKTAPNLAKLQEAVNEQLVLVPKQSEQDAKVERPREMTSPLYFGIRHDSKEFEDCSDTSYSLSVDLFQFSQQDGSSRNGSFAMTEAFEEAKVSINDKDRSWNNLNRKGGSVLENKARTNTTQFSKKYTDSVLSNDDSMKMSLPVSPPRNNTKKKKTMKAFMSRKVLENEDDKDEDIGFVMRET